MIELAASILSADFARLGEQVQEAVAGGATVLHLDVMDGHFVPNMVHHVLVMSVNPGFGGQAFIPASLRKIEQLARVRESHHLQFRIEVDGGVHPDTVADLVQAGAEILVAGSAIFGEGRPCESAKRLLKLARDPRTQTPEQRRNSPVERMISIVDGPSDA